MQIFYISNRPDILKGTLVQVSRLMPFIDRVLVVAPGKMREAFDAPAAPLPLDFIEEESLLAASTLKALNHQGRNFQLRAAAMRHPLLDDVFIMSDDDARPMRAVVETDYLENGRYHRYFFYDLADWPHGRTDFDRGQMATYTLLHYYSLPHLSYASHMPQIIDKTLFLQMWEKMGRHLAAYPICEWSSYFNYAAATYPKSFHPPQMYRTFCWPDFPATWLHVVTAGNFLFENYSPWLYRPGELFHELADCPRLDELDQVNLEKLMRWQQAFVGRIETHLVDSDPWLRRSMMRRLVARASWPIKLFTQFICMEERQQLLSLCGRMHAVEAYLKESTWRKEANIDKENES